MSLSAIVFCKSNAQAIDDALSATIPQCMRLKDYKFCDNNNVSTNPNKPAYEGWGYCCPIDSESANCVEEENDSECTIGDLSLQGEPLYKTFWVGMTRSTVCNSTETALVADSSRQY